MDTDAKEASIVKLFPCSLCMSTVVEFSHVERALRGERGGGSSDYARARGFEGVEAPKAADDALEGDGVHLALCGDEHVAFRVVQEVRVTHELPETGGTHSLGAKADRGPKRRSLGRCQLVLCVKGVSRVKEGEDHKTLGGVEAGTDAFDVTAWLR